MLSRIFGLKRKEITREWRELRNERIYSLYSSPGIIRQTMSRRMRWTNYVACIEYKKCNILVGKPETRRAGRSRRRL